VGGPPPAGVGGGGGGGPKRGFPALLPGGGGGGGGGGNAALAERGFAARVAPHPALAALGPPSPRCRGARGAHPHYRSSTDERALRRCVSCFTLGPADALYGWRRHPAIGDCGRSPTARPSWAFPPPTGPRWLPPAGPFSMCEWFRIAGG